MEREAASNSEDLLDVADVVRLKATTRKLCFQLLGPPPEHQAAFNQHPDGSSRTEPANMKPTPTPIAEKDLPEAVSNDALPPPKAVKSPRRKKEKAETVLETSPETARPDTPIMQRYRAAKEKHPDMLLLFRIGDFYEVFDKDAETAHKILGLTLTTRDRALSMAGFPHHQLETYLHTLLKAGLRVAVCDQVDADDGKTVRREVQRVVAPASMVEEPKPVKQPRHFVLSKFEAWMNENEYAFIAIQDVKKTTPAVASYIAGLDFIVLRGEDKLLVTVRPNLPAKNRNAAAEVQKLFGSPYRSVRIWPTDTANGWRWDEYPIDLSGAADSSR